MTCLLQQTCGALGPCFGSLRPFFHFYFKFYWGIVHLHCCLSFQCTAKSICCTYTYIHSFLGSFSCRSLLSSLYFTVVSYQLSILIFYIEQYVCVNPSLPIYPSPPLSHVNRKFIFYICYSTSVLQISSFVAFCYIPYVSNIIFYFSLTSLSLKISRSSHVAANGIILPFLMAG